MKREVVFLAPIQWDFLWQRPQIFATLFHEAGWKTVYVESTGIANPRIRDLGRIIFRRYGGIRKLRNPRPEDLPIINPLVLPPTFRLFKGLNRVLFLPKLAKRIVSTGISKPIIIAYPPTSTTLQLIELLPSQGVIYDCADNFEAFPHAANDIPQRERELGAKAKFITTSSPFLYGKLSRIFPEKTYPLYNGVDYQLFSRPQAGPVGKIRKACFYGTLDPRFNFPLVWGAARKLKDVEFHIVGPMKVKFPPPPANVRFHEPLPPHELVEFLKKCDLLLIPYRSSDWVKGVFPAKFFECLATGKPVVVSGIEENVKDYLHLVYPVKSSDELVAVVKNISSTENEEKVKERMRVARENSWEKRFEKLLQLIGEFWRVK